MKLPKAERREQILESARRLFIRNGYTRTTTLQVAREAGISEMTLFRHFPSKESIFKEAVKPLTVSLAAVSESARDKDFKTLLKDLLRDRFQVLINQRDLVRLVIFESFFSEDLGSNLAENISQIINSNIPAELTEMKEIVTRTIVGFILSFIFLPAGKENYDRLIDDFLEALLYPLVDR